MNHPEKRGGEYKAGRTEKRHQKEGHGGKKYTGQCTRHYSTIEKRLGVGSEGKRGAQIRRSYFEKKL